MKCLIVLVFILTAVSISFGQTKTSKMQNEILNLEKEFTGAIIKNDAAAIGEFLADDWIIIDPDGGIIGRAQFLGVIKSGLLTHESMESEEASVRIFDETAIVTALVTSKGKYAGQGFTSRERATDVFVKQKGRWRCVVSQLTRYTKK